MKSVVIEVLWWSVASDDYLQMVVSKTIKKSHEDHGISDVQNLKLVNTEHIQIFAKFISNDRNGI